MIVVRDPAALREWSRARRAERVRVGFVPTMGALHEGHLRLVDRARRLSDVVVTSIFVNPLQFGPAEDFELYPRDADHDGEMLAARGVDVLFLPAREVMYPADPVIRLAAPELTRTLCAPFRPGHFEGVLTVVTKLLHIIEPDVAVLGRKDLQQAVLIKRLVADLDLPVAIEVFPTVREADGLAMSSRNAYLSAEARVHARALSRALDAGTAAWRAGTATHSEILAATREVLARTPELSVQYVELVDPVALEAAEPPTGECALAVAALLGPTRLIDNVILDLGLAGDERVD